MEKYVYYFSSLADNKPKEVAWETVATEIRSDKLADICRRYRALLPEHDAAVAAGRPPRAKNLSRKVRQTVEADGTTYADEHATLTVSNGKQRKATVREVEKYIKGTLHHSPQPTKPKSGISKEIPK